MQLIQNNPKNASAVIIYHKKKILLILRSNHKKIFYPNCYGIFGGAKEKNETYLDTAKRELFEETNLNISKKHIQYLIDINFSLQKAVAMTSYNPSRYIGETNKGKIDIGYCSNFLVLDKELNIKEVYLNGQLI